MIDSLLSEIADRGWLVSNLFQLAPNLWQANLRTETHHTGWGTGPTPELALSAALDEIENAIPTFTPEVSYTYGVNPVQSLSTLLSNLRPKSTFNLRARL